MFRDQLPAEIQDLAAVARKVAVERIGPLVRETERARAFNPEIREILAEAGFLGLVVPERYGGVPADLRAEMVVVEEVAGVYPSAATYLTAHWVATKLLVRAAELGDPPAWLSDVLAAIARGEALGAIAATEPEAGSDLAGVRTRATVDGDEWVVDGGKRFITNGGHADFYVLVARTGDRGARGISLLYAESGRDGLDVSRFESKMGLHGSATAELVFTGLRLPTDHVVGPVDGGFGLLMRGLDEGRVVVAAMSTGLADAALAHATAYATTRSQFGQTIAEFQGIQFMLADMAIAVRSARALTYDAAHALVNKHADGAVLASIAKTVASDASLSVASDAVQVHGGYGYVDDFPVEMLMRDAKINQIYEGTNQLHRSLIARHLLKEAGR